MSSFWKISQLLCIVNSLLFPITSISQSLIEQEITPHFINKQRSDIGAALYHALQQQYWQEAEQLLQQYQQIPLHETLLVNYANALLAQVNGNFLQSEYYYQQQLKDKPDFIPAKTGIIQLYIQQKDYKKAQRALNELKQFADLSPAVLQSIHYYENKISTYFQGLRIYQISIIYNDNVNQASYRTEDVISKKGGVKVTRKSAKPTRSRGYAHFFSYYQPYFITSAHKLSSYISAKIIDYPSYTQASHHLFYAQFHYHYRASHYQWSLSSLYEMKAHYSKLEYQLWGGRYSFIKFLNKNHAINIHGDYKIKKYRKEFINLNDNELSQSVNYKYKINNQLLLINQITYQINRKKNHLLNYHRYGIKTGVDYLLNSTWDISFFLHYHVKRFNYYNPFLQKKREDTEIIFTTKIKRKAPIIWGFYPMAELRYTRNLSNVSWLYHYHQHEVLFKLEKTF